ncbi:hypothetical protein AR158_c003L [Paramecium bursaria Chlorella virus AR158]|uniref:hypothetical protein n=1 Tax=Paramecium bursaria Chlorella virus AR158 TaxID=380598 RepID=UPI00015AA6F2|nr:hypothetical protein AR158_c003L [Paramecium bursaria Chlorella virus AR158]ABU43549.1 hypothetical protein AR158_c003L [Paramecium bursaria Chlorella virus AR158]
MFENRVICCIDELTSSLYIPHEGSDSVPLADDRQIGRAARAMCCACCVLCVLCQFIHNMSEAVLVFTTELHVLRMNNLSIRD